MQIRALIFHCSGRNPSSCLEANLLENLPATEHMINICHLRVVPTTGSSRSEAAL